MKLEQSPNEIQPGPVPATIKIGVGKDAEGRSWVMIAFSTFVGENTFFLNAEMAEWASQRLEHSAGEARTGIVRPQMILPPARGPSPNGNAQP